MAVIQGPMILKEGKRYHLQMNNFFFSFSEKGHQCHVFFRKMITGLFIFKKITRTPFKKFQYHFSMFRNGHTYT